MEWETENLSGRLVIEKDDERGTVYHHQFEMPSDKAIGPDAKRNILEAARVLDEQDFSRLLAEHKQMTASLTPAASVEIPDELDAAIRLHVKHVYEKYNGNLSKTSEALKAARNTVRKYLE